MPQTSVASPSAPAHHNRFEYLVETHSAGGSNGAEQMKSSQMRKHFSWLLQSSVLLVACPCAANAGPIVAFSVTAAGGVFVDYPYRVGNYFVVGDRPIAVFSLGVFDDLSIPGISNPIHVGLFDNVGVGHLLSGADLWMGAGAPSHSNGGMQFVKLPSPILLPPHFEGSIVAAGFNAQDPLAATCGRAFILSDGGDGAISFPSPYTGWVTYDSYLGTTKGSYVDEPIIYGVSFEYQPVPEPGSLLLLAAGFGSMIALTVAAAVRRRIR